MPHRKAEGPSPCMGRGAFRDSRFHPASGARRPATAGARDTCAHCAITQRCVAAYCVRSRAHGSAAGSQVVFPAAVTRRLPACGRHSLAVRARRVLVLIVAVEIFFLYLLTHLTIELDSRSQGAVRRYRALTRVSAYHGPGSAARAMPPAQAACAVSASVPGSASLNRP